MPFRCVISLFSVSSKWLVCTIEPLTFLHRAKLTGYCNAKTMAFHPLSKTAQTVTSQNQHRLEPLWAKDTFSNVSFLNRHNTIIGQTKFPLMSWFGKCSHKVLCYFMSTLCVWWLTLVIWASLISNKFILIVIWFLSVMISVHAFT